MGYFTYHEVEVDNLKDVPQEQYEQDIIAMAQWLIDNTSEFEGTSMGDVDNIYGLIEYDALKWYDSTVDMTNLSKEFPDYGFVITGYGDDRDDIWKEYFHNGKSQFEGCRFVFGENELW